MSEFAVPVVRLDKVMPHPNADRLDIAWIGDFQTIVLREFFKKDDLVIYVPEGALVPEDILKKEGLEGKLSGGGRNRVKAIKLRGILSQGLTFSAKNYPISQEESDNVAEILGIEKYEPTIPAHLAGQVGALQGYTISYDIENIKRYPDILEPDEMIVLTEKLHGTYCQIGWCRDIEPKDDLFVDGRAFVTSKGIARHGQYLKNNDENQNNLYVKIAKNNSLIGKMVRFAEEMPYSRFYLMGEVFGDVQDLKYGHKPGEVSFRVFDIAIQRKNESFVKYLNFEIMEEWSRELEQIPVPRIGQPMTWGQARLNLEGYTKGNSTYSSSQIREGIVIRPLVERRTERHGRVIFKSVSEDYLLRSGETTELA